MYLSLTNDTKGDINNPKFYFRKFDKFEITPLLFFLSQNATLTPALWAYAILSALGSLFAKQ